MDVCKARVAANLAAPPAVSSASGAKKRGSGAGAADVSSKAQKTAAATSASAAAALQGVVANMAAARIKDAEARLEGDELASELKKIFEETREQMKTAVR